MLQNLNCAQLAHQGRKWINVGIDMGKNNWLMTAYDYESGKRSRHTFRGATHDLDCYRKIGELVKTGKEVHVTYEAGRNGFAPARVLEVMFGVEVSILPVNKLEMVSTGKKAKTDGLDSGHLSELDPRVVRMPQVWRPTIDEECRRGMQREKKRIERNIGRANNQIISILQRWPDVKINVHRSSRQWKKQLDTWRGERGCLIPALELARIANMVRELETFEQNLASWEQTICDEEERERCKAAARGEHTALDILRQYRGIGDEIARTFAWHIGDFHRFKNGGAFASYLGLTPTPYSSGQMNREQGISKAGNPELRRLLVQLAWLWSQWQPESYLAKKWSPKLRQKGRHRKTAIVALARQLAVAMYRRIVHGEEIAGAVKNAPLANPAEFQVSPAARVSP